MIRRTPLARPLWISALASLLLGLSALQEPATTDAVAPDDGAAQTVAAPPITVILVRHAEKRTDDPTDPALSEAGEARAKALAHLLEAAGVTHLFATEYRRTRATLEPLAQATKLEIEVRSARDPGAQIEALRALPPGSVAVVAGHSNTIPGLATRLGTPPTDLVDSKYGPMFDDASYDRALMVTLGDGEGVAPKLVELRIPAR